MSNCKPGDLAMVTRTCKNPVDGRIGSCLPDMIGRTIVKVKTPVLMAPGVLWILESPAKCPNSDDCTWLELPDEILTPIKGPDGPEDDESDDRPLDVIKRELDNVNADIEKLTRAKEQFRERQQ